MGNNYYVLCAVKLLYKESILVKITYKTQMNPIYNLRYL